MRAHKLASRVTPLGVYDAMLAGDDLEALRRELPEELWPDFDAIRAELDVLYLERELDIIKASALCRPLSMKQIGLSPDVGSHVKWAVFAQRNGKDILKNPKLRRVFFEAFRPTSNKLEGYSPSNALNRFQET